MTLCWHSFSEWGSNHTPSSFANSGRQYHYYTLVLPNDILITWLTRPKIIDARLRFIFRMGHWLCWFLFCKYRLPILQLYVTTTKWHFNYLTSAKNSSVWAEWPRRSGSAPSEPSETTRWRIPLHPVPIQRVTFITPSNCCFTSFSRSVHLLF
jgi:hypothetical protein